MSENTCPSADYTMGYSDAFRRMLNWRSARSHAACLLPQIASGRKLLDFGCGPDTISVGLARVVEPGDLHGIDIEKSQISLPARRRTWIPAHQGNVRRPAGPRHRSFPQPLAWGARRGIDAKWCPDGSPSFP